MPDIWENAAKTGEFVKIGHTQKTVFHLNYVTKFKGLYVCLLFLQRYAVNLLYV